MKQRAAREVEQSLTLLGGQPPDQILALFSRQAAQINQGQSHRLRWHDGLDRPLLDGRKDCTQDLMSSDNFAQTLFERRSVHYASETHGLRNVVGRIARLQL